MCTCVIADLNIYFNTPESWRFFSEEKSVFKLPGPLSRMLWFVDLMSSHPPITFLKEITGKIFSCHGKGKIEL